MGRDMQTYEMFSGVVGSSKCVLFARHTRRHHYISGGMENVRTWVAASYSGLLPEIHGDWDSPSENSSEIYVLTYLWKTFAIPLKLQSRKNFVTVARYLFMLLLPMQPCLGHICEERC